MRLSRKSWKKVVKLRDMPKQPPAVPALDVTAAPRVHVVDSPRKSGANSNGKNTAHLEVAPVPTASSQPSTKEIPKAFDRDAAAAPVKVNSGFGKSQKRPRVAKGVFGDEEEPGKKKTRFLDGIDDFDDTLYPEAQGGKGGMPVHLRMYLRTI